MTTRKLKTICKHIIKLENEIRTIEHGCEYPYKQGYMVRIDTKRDVWGVSKRTAKMLNDRHDKLYKLVDEITSRLRVADLDGLYIELDSLGLSQPEVITLVPYWDFEI